MIASYEVTARGGPKMSCRYFTPENAHHQEHMGNKIADGTFADDGHADVPDEEYTRVCTHASPDGSGPPTSAAVVRKDSLAAAAPERETPVVKRRKK